jgi:hypothetical protein
VVVALRGVTPRIVRFFLVVGAALASASSARTARAADPQEQQLAQALFDEGRALMEKKRFPEACAKLAESQRLDPGGGTLLNLAVCHEKDGKLATAKVAYEDALAAAKQDKRKDRQAIARERLAALEPLLPRLRVLVTLSTDMEGLELKLDGMVLRRAAWGVATAVDPGSHVIEATGPNRTPWTTAVVVEASQKKTVDVPRLAPLSQLPQSGAPLLLGATLPASNTHDAHDARNESDDNGGMIDIEGVVGAAPVPPPYQERKRNPIFYTTLGVTLVAAGTSAVTGVLAFTANRDAKSGCLADRTYCRDQASIDASERAHSFAWASTVSLGVAAAGFVALLIVPSRLHASTTVGVLDLSGTF